MAILLMIQLVITSAQPVVQAIIDLETIRRAVVSQFARLLTEPLVMLTGMLVFIHALVGPLPKMIQIDDVCLPVLLGLGGIK